MARERVSIIIDAKDRASREFKNAEGGLNKLRAAGKAAAIAITAVGTAALGAGVAFTRLAERGGEVLNVQRAFNNLFPEGTAALEGMRQATFGLINDYTLMQKANQAVILGAAKTADGFSDLAQKAILLGRAQGVDALQSLDSLVTGIARQSRMLLDNIGITVRAEQAYQDYADEVGKSVEELTDAERKQAFFNDAMRQADAALEGAGDAAFNNADNVARMKTAWINARDAAAEWVATSPAVTEYLDNLESGFRAAAFEGGRLAAVWERLTNGTPDTPGVPGFGRNANAGLQGEPTSFLAGEALRQGREPFTPTVGAPPIGRTLPGAPFTMPGFGAFGITPPGAIPGATRSTGLTAPSPDGMTATERLIAGGAIPPGFEGESPLHRVEESLEDVGEKGDESQAALYAAAGAFETLGIAAIRGAEDIETILIPSIANIAASAVGGPLGAVIGAAGSVVGALFGGGDNDRPRVVVDDYGPEAERKMEQAQERALIQSVSINGSRATPDQLRALRYDLDRIDRLRGGSTGVG